MSEQKAEPAPFKLQLEYTPQQMKIFFEGDQSARFTMIKKGRRFGFTQGAEKYCIEQLIDGHFPILWVDKVNGDIDRYVERYFKPDLKRLPKGWWQWNQQKRILYVRNSYMDFRSADRPETLEGFGYKLIIINEAGIILKNDYIYTQAILPMMIDYEDSRLIAAGVPKGKTNKDGSPHRFYTLCEKARKKEPGYRLLEFTSYDNPLNEVSDIEEIKAQLSPKEREQEIEGEFVEMAGENPFLYNLNQKIHFSERAVFDPRKRLIISTDFNLNPFAVIFGHLFSDQKGIHDHTFDEAEIKNGSVPAMIDLIKERYSAQIPNCYLTGDAGSGNNSQLSLRDRASFFKQMQSGLGLKDWQIAAPRPPTHAISRQDCNYLLYHSAKEKPDLEIIVSQKRCPLTCRDLEIVQCDAFGQIIKKDRKDVAQRADFLDAYRYKINTFWKKWILQHMKRNKLNPGSK